MNARKRKMLDVPEALCGNAGLPALLLDVVLIMSRALAAPRYYETLKVASDQVLEGQGLTRGDVRRAVYRMLTGGH